MVTFARPLSMKGVSRSRDGVALIRSQKCLFSQIDGVSLRHVPEPGLASVEWEEAERGEVKSDCGGSLLGSFGAVMLFVFPRTRVSLGPVGPRSTRGYSPRSLEGRPNGSRIWSEQVDGLDGQCPQCGQEALSNEGCFCYDRLGRCEDVAIGIRRGESHCRRCRFVTGAGRQEEESC